MNDRRFGKPENRIRLTDLLSNCKTFLTHASWIFHTELSWKGTKEMANRKGVFIGAYVPNQLKEALQQRAKSEHRTLSQEITRILEEAIRGKRLPPGTIDRRTEASGPRRRATDPLPRRREVDVPYIPSERSSGDE